MNTPVHPTKINKGGFTLLELLVVVGILALLALIVFVAIDPLRQFAEGRNARRWSDVNNISTAIFRYIIDNKSFPSGLDGTERQIGTATSGCSAACVGAASSCLNLASQMSPYLISMPFDPKGGTAALTYYTVTRNSDNVITVRACAAENGTVVQISR